MGMRGRPRTVTRHALWVALLIQGVTPDAEDLASPWLFRRLAEVVADQFTADDDLSTGRGAIGCAASKPPAAGFPPSLDEHQGETSDEVCLRPETLTRLLMGLDAVRLRPAGPLPPATGPRSAPSGHRSTRPSGTSARGDRPILSSLCRLSC